MRIPIAAAVLVLLLAGCASATKMHGEQALGSRLVVNPEGPWNRIDLAIFGPADVWTMEGIPIDQLLVYPGIKNEQVVHGAGGPGKTFAFRSTMQPEEVVAMFEGMLTRDGSQFKLSRLEPVSFGGGKGFRFEYSVIRRADGVILSGLGYGAVSQGELFALLYHAPRLTFFPRHRGAVEQMARSAHIKQVDAATYQPDTAHEAQCARNPSLLVCQVDRAKPKADPARENRPANPECVRNPWASICR
ncbi:MAG TPA: hypothetical protein VFC18_13140 [Burkholderiales bacterium]|nr:hypothetical protein [Burkholderiales bacterium]